MPNDIYTNPPEWNAEGIEPTQTKKDDGWQPGERPPAPWLNWWMHRTFQSLREIAQAFIGHRDATSGVHGIPEGEDIATEGYVDDAIEPVAQGLSEHINREDNPHGVTKAQVGLGNVDNVKQAPKSEFDAHVGKALGQADSHPMPTAADVGAETPAGAQAKADAAAGAVASDLSTHESDQGAHGATSAATPSRIVRRDSSGRARFADPVHDQDAATKGYVDTLAEHKGAGTDSVVLGSGASANYSYATALGHNASANGPGATALGHNASAEGLYATALGRNASVEGSYATALGYIASAANNDQGTLGRSSTSWTVPGSFTVSGTKNFEIPHPHPAKRDTHRLRHASVEAPTAGDTLYRYTVTATEDNETVTVQLPDYFPYLNTNVDVWVNGDGHFGRAYGTVDGDELLVTCEIAGDYKVLVIGTRNDDHPSVQDWHIRGVEREVGESWTGETYAFEVDEIIEVDEIMEVA